MCQQLTSLIYVYENKSYKDVATAIKIHFCCHFFSVKALKVLRTSEFLPYVVFIEAPDFEVLKAMNKTAIESGFVTKQLTVSVFFIHPTVRNRNVHLL